jgi:acyl-CoA synthetase (NDP forming)
MKQNTQAIHQLMSPKSVAVIGASTDPSKTAGRPVAYLLKHQFKGKIYPVNPRVESISGLTCYPDIASLPETPDVAIILLGIDRALIAVKELAARGTPAAIVLTSGYAEVGEEGIRKQEELIKAAGSMRILGPNTIGIVNVTETIPLSPSSALEMDQFPSGCVSVVSQSGGILGSLLSRCTARGVGLSKLISTSNEADLDLGDFVNYLVDDESTKVIVLYVESIRHPEKFRLAALRAKQAGKPIVVFKVGKSEAGIKAAISHTGALAGSDKMYDALFKQVGVIRAHNFTDVLDIASALSVDRKLAGRRVAILTSSGGAGTLITDSLGVCGFETPVPDEKTAQRLRNLQPGDQAVLDRNPIDVTLAGLQPDLLRGAITALLDSPSYDALVIILGSSSLAMPELMAGAVKDSMHVSNKPVLAYVSPYAPNVAAIMTSLGVPAFTQPESCGVALSSMLHVHEWQTAKEVAPAIKAKKQSLGDLPKGSLNEHQAKALFAQFGIPSVREEVLDIHPVNLDHLAKLGNAVVLKVLSGAITHKTEVGGVAINVPVQDLSARIAQMAKDVQAKSGHLPEGFLVQEMVTGGVEFMMGMYKDTLGTAILVGMGGITAELFKDTAMCLLHQDQPLSESEALSLLKELKTWPLLDGYRGRPKCDVAALVQAIVGFSNLVLQMGDHLVEAEINPIFVFQEGQGVKAADGVVITV